MELWSVLLWGGVIVAGLAALYGLHRLCLWLEARGRLYYWHKRPEHGVGNCFVVWQQCYEPATKQVFEIKEEKRQVTEDDAPGPDDPPAAESGHPDNARE